MKKVLFLFRILKLAAYSLLFSQNTTTKEDKKAAKEEKKAKKWKK